MELPGLEGDVIALPSDGGAGGDLYALFSCGDHAWARMVLADCVGHGFTASGVARQVHQLLHTHRDIRETAALLGALNRGFEPAGEKPDAPIRLTTVVTANYHRASGLLSYAYAAHPRMLLWRPLPAEWEPLGEGLEGLPLGVIAGENYTEQSAQLEPGEILMAFSDAVTEVESPRGVALEAEGFSRLAGETARGLPRGFSLHDLAEGLLDALRRYQSSENFQDDLTLLLLRRL